MQNRKARQDRKVVLYFKSTGYEPEYNDRMLEIECLEIINGKQTDEHFHAYINPEDKAIPEEAQSGIGKKRLAKIKSASTFAELAPDLMDFICPAGQDKPDIIVHNAPYVDRHFYYAMTAFNQSWTTLADPDYCNRLIDTLEMARALHPFKKGENSNSLDSLCKRYKIDNSNRDCFSAKGDAEILLQVYQAMVSEIKHRQSKFMTFTHAGRSTTAGKVAVDHVEEKSSLRMS